MVLLDLLIELFGRLFQWWARPERSRSTRHVRILTLVLGSALLTLGAIVAIVWTLVVGLAIGLVGTGLCWLALGWIGR